MARKGCLFVCVFIFLTYEIAGQVGSICRPNERLLYCGGCQKTCKDPAPECKGVCKTGCYCPEDEVRNDTGHCVKLSECPSVAPHTLYSSEPRFTLNNCPENEEYRFCETCNRTCDNPNPICPAQCTRGCFCKDDLVRDRDGRCVRVEKCSNYRKNESSNYIKPMAYQMTCGPHQVYNDCRLCESTCSSPTPTCRSTCAAGCFCEPGYLKSPSGECVKLENCPRAEITMGGAQEPSIEDCSSDEIYLACGWCEPSCWEPRPECPLGICTRGCLCRPPLLRHHSGHCVEEKDCAPQKCSDPNEEFVCRYGCEGRCGTVTCDIRPRRCILGCHCRLGLLRDFNGKCVTAEKCAKKPLYVNKTLPPNTTITPKYFTKPNMTIRVADEDTSSSEESDDAVAHGLNKNIGEPMRTFFSNTSNTVPYSNFSVYPVVIKAMRNIAKMKSLNRIATTMFQKQHELKKSLYHDHNFEASTSSIDNRNLTEVSNLKSYTRLGVNTYQNIPTHSGVKEPTKQDLLDKSTVKILNTSNANSTEFKLRNVTDTKLSETSQTTAAPTDNITIGSGIKVVSHPKPNTKVIADIEDIEVPNNRKSHKPSKDVISRVVKFYKEMVVSTPASYLNTNVNNLPLTNKLSDLVPSVNRNHDKNPKDLLRELPASSRNTKNYVFSKDASMFNLFNITEFKTKGIFNKNETMGNIINNIISVVGEIFPMNFTIIN